jgi:transposase-like protein
MRNTAIDSTAAELRQAIAAAKGGRRNAHVPSALRKRALELLEIGRARGTSTRETAAALGIHATTLSSWRGEAEQSAPFVEARVVGHRRPEPEPAGEVVGRSSRSLRVTVIDGLDASALETVLRSLR